MNYFDYNAIGQLPRVDEVRVHEYHGTTYAFQILRAGPRAHFAGTVCAARLVESKADSNPMNRRVLETRRFQGFRLYCAAMQCAEEKAAGACYTTPEAIRQVEEAWHINIAGMEVRP